VRVLQRPSFLVLKRLRSFHKIYSPYNEKIIISITVDMLEREKWSNSTTVIFFGLHNRKNYTSYNDKIISKEINIIIYGGKRNG
jgi:glutamine amidotransferase-like uncharacterized protein